MTSEGLVTIKLIEYDLGRWIWVPHIWPHQQFSDPDSWADANSRAVAKRSSFSFMKRRALREDLVQMSLSRDGEGTNWTLAYAPNLSNVPRIARITVHDRCKGAYSSFEQFLQLDEPGLPGQPVKEPFTSPHLGDGVTYLMQRKAPDGTLVSVRGYGWEFEDMWASITIADFDARYVNRIRPHLDTFARTVTFAVDDIPAHA